MFGGLLGLDFHTLAFSVVLSTLMLSALLFTARFYAEGIRGIGFWALGNLAIGLGILLMVIQFDQPPRYLIPAIALIAFGNGLYINGIQAFFGKRQQYAIPVLLCLAIIVADLACLMLMQNVRLAMLCNTVVHFVSNAASAYLLLRYAHYDLRNPYGLTFCLFLGMALLMGARFVSVLLAAPADFAALDAWPINKLVFICAGLFQLCLAFGFVLMLNYRMAGNLRAFAAHDWLSGALNRRYLEDSAKRMAATCQRLNIDLAVVLFDLDHFKKVNDKFGHQIGDEVIRRFALVVRQVTRAGDIFGRYGGEEFCLMLANATAKDACVLGERIRILFEQEIFNFGGKTFSCSVSAGVSDSRAAGFDVDQLITTADKALYESKHTGRNRIVVYTVASTPVELGSGSYAG